MRSAVYDDDGVSLELTLPLAQQKQMGVIAQRPIANAAWKYAAKPDNDYHITYWQRLQELKYDFAQADAKDAASIALRFTLSVPGVHTAIVGTKNPARWRENAKLLEAGSLPREQFDAIRAQWKRVANSDWVGQI